MLYQEIIRIKRDGGQLAAEQIAHFIEGLTDGRVSEGAAAAFAMAVYFQGMNASESAALTLAMRDSGQVLTWDDGAPLLDKHSTGGVGDKVSLLLAPLMAACGARVPMISGRGLGHTGGTLDKLDSIAGYCTTPSAAEFAAVVEQAGCAIVGQTDELAPADRRLYAIRDVTATVESIPLITASILSKKLASGIDALVMDVKTGSGAFMNSLDDARKLAQAIVSTAKHAGLPAVALITSMDSPLGTAAGNALEVGEVIDALANKKVDARLREVTLALGAEMLLLGKLADDEADARTKLEHAWKSGAAAERFARMVAALGGPADIFADAALPSAPVVTPVVAAQAGWIDCVDTRKLGLAVLELGGGRVLPADKIDHAVGLNQLIQPGMQVDTQTVLAMIHARSNESAQLASEMVADAYSISDAASSSPAPAVIERIIG